MMRAPRHKGQGWHRRRPLLWGPNPVFKSSKEDDSPEALLKIIGVIAFFFVVALIGILIRAA
jgi:hypothetical protein